MHKNRKQLDLVPYISPHRLMSLKYITIIIVELMNRNLFNAIHYANESTYTFNILSSKIRYTINHPLYCS